MRFTKIVCTIGPASSDPSILAQLMRAGMDVARINFSHGSHADHADTIRRIRSISDELDRPIAILADLQGPKLRVGALPNEGVQLQVGKLIPLTTDPAPNNAIPCQYEELPSLVQPGDRLLLDDGLIELEVESASAGDIQARVITGGVLYSNKGINLPRADSRIPAITEKDRQDLLFAVEQRVDWIALSFVREADELLELRALLRKHGRAGQLPQIIAKIEKPEAVENIESILQAADGIMVARGDLGIELPTEEVPLTQKRIIRLCNRAGRPVITATQMLDSMIRNPRPTRAEASDVANAVLDGTDAVMLSAETAAGRYPVQAVQTMARIVTRVESELPVQRERKSIESRYNYAAQAIAHAASDLAKNLGASAIIAPTTSGYTARQISRYRPGLPVIAVTPNPMVRRQLNLHWGLFPIFSPRRNTTDEVISDAVEVAQKKGFVKEGELVVITAGAGGSTPGTTNLIKVQLIEEVLARGTGIGQEKVRGKVRKLTPPLRHDLKFDLTDIVVAHALDSSWQQMITHAGAIVVEEGSRQSYAARLAEDLHIPALVGATGAFQNAVEGEKVVLDPVRGMLYRGVSLDDVSAAKLANPPQPK
ncbi:MAG: pyruvate kinase [Caldilineales bacterium]|nr:pyruvate kinase [Caldilineales bacterium]